MHCERRRHHVDLASVGCQTDDVIVTAVGEGEIEIAPKEKKAVVKEEVRTDVRSHATKRHKFDR